MKPLQEKGKSTLSRWASQTIPQTSNSNRQHIQRKEGRKGIQAI